VYLQELHGQNLATPDHTTLLLNCYAKTLDKARLDAFIKSETSRTGSDDLPFDLDTAIRVCRQAGFHEHAVYLAKRYERHSDYLKIQLEDRDNLDAVMVYLRTLPQEMVSAIHFLRVMSKLKISVPLLGRRFGFAACQASSPATSRSNNRTADLDLHRVGR